MQIIRQLSLSLAPLALAALTTTSFATLAFPNPAPQLAGSAAGQWVKVSERTTTVHAVLGHRADRRAYELEALLIGKERGQIFGQIEELAPDVIEGEPQGEGLLHLVFEVQGDYIDLGDGSIYVRAQILLNLVPFGGSGMIPVGVLDGQLLETSLGGYCPGPLSSDPLSDSELLPVGGGAPLQNNVPHEPLARPVRDPLTHPQAPVAEPLRSGKFVGQWQMS